MKTLVINLDKSLKKQIQAVAKIAASSDEVRYYLGFVQIERTGKGLVFTATNGHIMADVVVNKFEATNFEIGEKLHVHSSGLLKFDSKAQLLIEAVDKKATINCSVIVEILEADRFPAVERVRIKEKPATRICLNPSLLKMLADCGDSLTVEIHFDREYSTKACLIKSKNSSFEGVFMPANY